MHATTRRGFAALVAAGGRDRARDWGRSRAGRDPGAGHARAAGRNDPCGARAKLPLGAWSLGLARSLGLDAGSLHRRRRPTHACGDCRNAAGVARSGLVLGSRPLRLGARRMGLASGALGSLNLAIAGRRAAPPHSFRPFAGKSGAARACRRRRRGQHWRRRPEPVGARAPIAVRRILTDGFGRPPVAHLLVAQQSLATRIAARRAPARRLVPPQFASRRAGPRGCSATDCGALGVANPIGAADSRSRRKASHCFLVPKKASRSTWEAMPCDRAVGLILPKMPGPQPIFDRGVVLRRADPDWVVHEGAVRKDRLVKVDRRVNDRPLAVVALHLLEHDFHVGDRARLE